MFLPICGSAPGGARTAGQACCVWRSEPGGNGRHGEGE